MANEHSFDHPLGKGSVWSSYLMDQGDKKPKPGNVLTNKNHEGEFTQTTQALTITIKKK